MHRQSRACNVRRWRANPAASDTSPASKADTGTHKDKQIVMKKADI